MSKKIPLSPFPISGYYGPEYFCDRGAESQRLINNISGGLHTTLFSIRRLGKTGLIHHVFEQIKGDQVKIFIDLLPTNNLKEFVSTLASAMFKSIPQESSLGQKFFNFLTQLRPLITYDTLTGTPEVTLNIDRTNTEEITFSKLIEFIKQQNGTVVIAIDEFQQINNYPEKNVEALLRTGFQQLLNTTFIFCGSQQHLLTEMFMTAKRPFFGSTQMMKLNKIDEANYRNFIIGVFDKHGRQISIQETNFILQWTKRHTYYTQLVCNRLFLTANIVVTDEIVKSELHQILLEHEQVFYNYRKLLTTQQWNLVKAIAKEDIVHQPTARGFIQIYKLGSSSIVKRSLDALIKKEVIFQEYDTEGKSSIQIYDVLLSRWLENQH
jgi:uncharacterized protein